MTSLNNLLNPESGYENNLRAPQSRSPSSSVSSPPENANERSNEGDYYGQTNITITPHEPHPNCPDTLTCLPDTDGRPQHTLPVILRCAILGSPKKRLTIREIYAAMEKKYPYYKTAGPAWKQSVRHHLSLNRLFERQPRPATDPGFGSYWTVNLDAPPGTKRPRKRGRANKEASANGQSVHPDHLTHPLHVLHPGHPVHPVVHLLQPGHPLHLSQPIHLTHPIRAIPPPPVHGIPITNKAHTSAIPYLKTQEKTPEPEYRPPPIATLRPVDSRSFSKISSLRRNEYYDDDDDDDMDWDDDGARASEYDSTEDMPYQYKPRASSSSSHTLSSQPSRPALYGAFSGHSNSGYRTPDTQDPIIERLKMEMAGLRRQSTDAVNASLRMSSQLSDAQAEASRARASLKVAESRMDEEIRRRREAEHVAEEEARLRLAAEDALRAYQLQRRPPGYSSSRS
ncbi:uncharacterized protein LAESUDRAFT_723570 [Laetiporus sulphureus 93-53]|uniref:Fork-head domain-containing protein n=1 Tax=Laetiporus sulphureus 93-53 TaxID=1314785 RepID=A0A165FAD5_9APHY|nr:uncharacterized protein LAESUDRAFT_723570 [Laetiporus sulphureus 93-53]KZT08670.1 hypothetical protein LAESUDRAFT_723570 [Laetiporus sulphureus 93-53]